MYPVVSMPKKEPTKAWLKQAFAPLQHNLEKHKPEEAEKILGYLMFMGNADGRFYYRIRIYKFPSLSEGRIHLQQHHVQQCSLSVCVSYLL